MRKLIDLDSNTLAKLSELSKEDTRSLKNYIEWVLKVHVKEKYNNK